MAYYADLIRGLAPDLDPGQAEAVIRLQHPTLDHLTRAQFADELEIARLTIAEMGPAEAAELAATFGF